MVAQIKIYDAVIKEDGHLIVNHIEVPEPIRFFFTSNKFYARYEVDVSGVPQSILNIPAYSTIAHFAWAAGYNISIGEIDEDYLNGAEKARQLLKTHPGFEGLNFISYIKAEPIKNNFTPSNNGGLLFSGGVDSTASWIAHRHEAPQLITIWGIDIPLNQEWREFWNRIIELYKWMNITTIVTNTESIYSGVHQSYYGTPAGIVEGYMPGYSFSINRLGVCAPLATALDIGNLMLSSTYPSREYGNPLFPWTQNRVNAIIDECLSWSGTKVFDVEQEYSTTEKIKFLIKPYFDKYGPLTIRSCGHIHHLGKVKDRAFNCNICDKCQRVIGSLVVNGIDPNTCGFKISEETYKKIIHDIENRIWNPLYLKYHWEEVKKFIPDMIEEDFNGSKKFLEWLRDYEFE